MFCNKCGSKLPDSASFCNRCGNKIAVGTNGTGFGNQGNQQTNYDYFNMKSGMGSVNFGNNRVQSASVLKIVSSILLAIVGVIFLINMFGSVGDFIDWADFMDAGWAVFVFIIIGLAVPIDVVIGIVKNKSKRNSLLLVAIEFVAMLLIGALLSAIMEDGAMDSKEAFVIYGIIKIYGDMYAGSILCSIAALICSAIDLSTNKG